MGDLIQAWIDHHNELPTTMSRRIRRHFKVCLIEKTALHDSEVLKDLSPELQTEVSKYLINDDVRHNLLFEGMPAAALSRLVACLQTTHTEANERIVTMHEPGMAMFIIYEGTAIMTFVAPSDNKNLGTGDSFGEEIILGLEEQYLYTVISTSKMSIHMIPEDAFIDTFQTTPHLLALMTETFYSATSHYGSRSPQ